MNHKHFKQRHNKYKQRTLSILPKLEQDPSEQRSRGKTLRVSRLLSINAREFSSNTNSPFQTSILQEPLIMSPIRKTSLSIKLEALDNNVTLRKSGPMNYWAKLAYRQSLQDTDRQHRNV